jgi:hypothetical protein
MKKTPLKRGTSVLKRSGFKKRAKPPFSYKKPVKLKIKPTRGISKLRKDLWKVFSLHIRTRDKFTCFTCGKVGQGAQIHSGHFITGATCSPELYFDENNVHAQCYHCNINLSGNWVVYEQRMNEKYGDVFVDNLKLRRTREMGIKKDTEWYLEKIKHYELALQSM